MDINFSYYLYEMVPGNHTYGGYRGSGAMGEKIDCKTLGADGLILIWISDEIIYDDDYWIHLVEDGV